MSSQIKTSAICGMCKLTIERAVYELDGIKRAELDIASRAGVLTSMGGIIFAGATVHYWQGMLAFVMFIFGSGVWILSRPDASPSGTDAASEPGVEAAPPEPPANGKKN